MRRILVSGLINIETTLQVEGFPIDYEPVRFPFFGIQSSVSGVGYNVAKALTVLGDDVRFLSLIGEDMAGRLVLESLADRRHFRRARHHSLASDAAVGHLVRPYGPARHQHGLEGHSGCSLSG